MKLGIENFRSIRQQEVELAPITVVYGPNGAGKSSLLYALLTLKNVVMNPNQSPNGFFNYGFANLDPPVRTPVSERRRAGRAAGLRGGVAARESRRQVRDLGLHVRQFVANVFAARRSGFQASLAAARGCQFCKQPTLFAAGYAPPEQPPRL